MTGPADLEHEPSGQGVSPPPRGGTAGRFALLETIATGGDRVLYRAYDPRLERKVALEVMTVDDDDARQRLLAAGRALARLRHPNVVPVFDVVVADDQVVLVMELVEGQPLDAWEAARPRSWAEVLAVYVGAGRGLAAAHADGLVLGGFAPDRIQIGRDGRARLLGFGLEPGAAIAPEELAGGAPSARSDQFAFCAALYRALFGVAPFTGATTAAMLSAIRAGDVAKPTARAPGWLRRLVRRGLAFDPDARHPSMTAMLDQIERERRRRGWRRVAAAAVLAAAVACVHDRLPASSLELCEAAAGSLRQASGPVQHTAVVAHLTAIGAEAPVAVARRLEDRRDAYVATHLAVCRARERRELSAGGLAANLHCLAWAPRDLRRTGAFLLELDGPTADRTEAVLEWLPDVAAWCRSRPHPGEDQDSGERRAAVAAVHDRLRDAELSGEAGRLDRADAAATSALDDARTLGIPALTAYARLIGGRIAVRRGDVAAATPTIQAAHAALLAAVDSPAARERAQALYRAYQERGEFALQLQDPTVFDSAHPLLLHAIGRDHLAAGDRDAAREFFDMAQHMTESLDAVDLELSAIDADLLRLTDPTAVRLELTRQTWQRRRARLGAEHVLTLDALVEQARLVPDPALALPLFDEASEILGRTRGDDVSRRAPVEYARGWLATELDDAATGAARYGEAAAIATCSAVPELRGLAAVATGYASLARGDARAALPSFDDAVGVLAASARADAAAWTAAAQLGMGLAELALGRGDRAVAHLELAEAGLQRARTDSRDLAIRQRHALARLSLAAALRAGGDRDPRAVDLERAAAAFYRAAGAITYAARLEHLEGVSPPPVSGPVRGS